MWITPTDDNLPENNDDNEDGLRVCGDYAANKLFSEGISIYPSVHTEYLSKSNDLSIDLFTRCNITTSELIPRKSNRLVVVRAGRPYVFTTPGNVIGKPFESSTMTAFVVILSQSNLL